MSRSCGFHSTGADFGGWRSNRRSQFIWKEFGSGLSVESAFAKSELKSPDGFWKLSRHSSAMSLQGRSRSSGTQARAMCAMTGLRENRAFALLSSKRDCLPWPRRSLM